MEENIAKDEQKTPQNKPDGLEVCQKRCEEYLNNWKRSAADFDNYKKEEMERMALLARYAKEDTIHKIMPILDSFYLAEKQLPENLKRGKGGSPQAIEWTKGFLQIQKQIAEFLKKEGVEEIQVVGEKFNSETMEVIEQADGGLTPADSGVVVQELQKGYKMGDKVIRPAKVKVMK